MSRWNVAARSALSSLSVAFAFTLLAPPPTVSATLRTSARYEGTIGVEIAAVAHDVARASSGVLTLSLVPPGATILRAALYSTTWFGDSVPSAAFDGNGLSPGAPFDSDGASTLVYGYRWDVTSFVSGPGSYAASSGPLTYSYGMALVVVFSHPSLPFRTIVLNDGCSSVGEGARPGIVATSFQSIPPGPAEVWIYTEADDARATGEQVRFNGAAIGGPLDGNLGAPASILRLSAPAIDGTNVLELETIADWFGLHVAVLVTPGSCLAGNVNAGRGAPVNVLFVNDLAGDAERTVRAATHEPLSIFMAPPPSATGSAAFALYAYAGTPDSLSALPAGIGESCMPMPPVGGHPRLRVIWNNVGRFTRLGFPSLPSAAAPNLVYSAPDGLGKRATFFLQGLIVDTASPSGRAAITNGVIVKIL